MKTEIAIALVAVICTIFPNKTLAANNFGPGGVVPSTADIGRVQNEISRDRPAATVDNQVIIEEEPADANIAKAQGVEFTLKSVSLEGNTVFKTDELAQFYGDKVGKKVTLADMYAVRDAITKYYREKGYILSRAIIPAQKLTSGDADFKFRIIEGYINKVSVEGDFKGNKSILDSYISKIKSDGPLNSANLERYVLLINDLAGETANAVLKPATGPGMVGASDLIITIHHTYVDGVVTFDNSGSKYLGRDLFTGEANLNSALGESEKISARGILSTNVNELQFGDVSLQLPIDDEGTKIKFLAGKTKTDPGSTLKDLDIDGLAKEFEVTVTHPFYRSRKENFNMRADFDVRDTDTNTLGFGLYNDKTRELTVGGTYDLADNLGGVNLLDLSTIKGLDIFNQSDASDGKSRAEGTPNFTSLNYQASRLQHLSDDWGLLFASEGQYSFDPLLAQDQFGVGGSQFGRGFDFSEITGDSGVAGKIELQYGIDIGTNWLNNMQLYTFFDVGHTWDRSTPADVKDQSTLDSAGLGTRFNLFNSASGFFELAQPIDRDVASEGNKGVEVDFGISYLF